MSTLLVLLIVTLLNGSLGDESSRVITCDDVKQNHITGWFADELNADKNATKNIRINFYFSTNSNKEPVEFDINDWSYLKNNGFDATKKTFIITHGNGTKEQNSWIWELKDTILDSREGNVFVVDWSTGSTDNSYVIAAKSTVLVSKRIFDFLKTLPLQIDYFQTSFDDTIYNHLHLIGHDVGAHICGQIGYLLKNDSFWNVDRITALDPTNPCFSNIHTSLKVDPANADFVDVIHTQGSKSFSTSLGINDASGHTDFYVNGGIAQPGCRTYLEDTENYLFDYDIAMCSHKLAIKYFIESTRTSQANNCTFQIQRWRGTHSDADQLIGFLKKGLNCNNCPKMGMNAANSTIQGSFLVLAGIKEPYCKFDFVRDLKYVMHGINTLIYSDPIYEELGMLADTTTQQPDVSSGGGSFFFKQLEIKFT